jgi:hypothetical protein
MIEARDERLLRLQKQMASVELLIIDELGFVPLSKTGAELLFELISQRYERGATIITSNLPFDEWTAAAASSSTASASPRSRCMSAMTTLAPSSTNNRTVASPMPLAPPVKTATLPSNSVISEFLIRLSDAAARAFERVFRYLRDRP